MITLRMLALAAALLVSIPIGFALADHRPDHVQVPGDEVFDAWGGVVAWITDVELVDPPGSYDRLQVHNAPEQLVEGHTVFVTWDIQRVRNVTNWSADIIGQVNCDHKVNATGEYWNGIPIPTRVNEAHLECQFGETMIVTPDPFYDSQNTYQQNAATSPLAPTGRTMPFTAPSGESGEAVEYEYVVYGTDWLGNDFSRTVYAWEVPILEGWTHTDGKPRNWYCPIPQARLQEMGLGHFVVFHERDTPSWLRFAEVQGEA